MDRKSGASVDPWDYLDFELEIREGGPRDYPVAVRSPAGEALGEMKFPFDEWELGQRLQALEISLLRSGGTRRRIASAEEQTVQDFGRSLFEALLVGEIRTRYEVSLREARRQNRGLRLKLRIRPPELAVLPWEFLYDAERDRYPSLSSKTPLVRYLDLPDPAEPVRVSPPLRVLGMVTSPQGLQPLDVEHEKRLVEEALRGLLTRGLVELTWLEGQTWRHLQRRMRLGEWHIFHFIGHGGFDPATEEGAIALAGEDDRLNLLRARSLAELLNDHYPLRLAFLNSCEGARGNNNDAFSSTAATLVRSGIPAVVAMQYEITDKAAIEFSRDFYEAVADGLPIDAAVTEARAAVSMDSMLEWGTPVLYMRSPDGRLFEIQKQAREDNEEDDALLRYREGVEGAWADGELHGDEIEALRDLAAGLDPDAAASIEREVMGDTIQGILESQKRVAGERYREAVERAWTNDRLGEADAERLHALAGELGLSAETAAGIERQAAGETVRDFLRRQDTEEQERQRYLNDRYDRGVWHMEAGEWRQAIKCFEEIQGQESNYRDTGRLLSEALQQAADRKERVRPEDSGGEWGRFSLSVLAESWRVLALRGMVVVILGLLIAIRPGIQYHDSFLVFGMLVMADGVLVRVAIRGTYRLPLLRVQGVTGILAGSAILIVAGLLVLLGFVESKDWFQEITQSMPLISDTTLVKVCRSFFAVWVVCVGASRIAMASRLGQEFKAARLMMVGGVLLTTFGMLTLLEVGIPGLQEIFGPLPLDILLLASGVSQMAFAFRVRSWQGSSTAR
ncbi:MAG: CHAT domain-containing protein [Rubrobacteraceae bacterium]